MITSPNHGAASVQLPDQPWLHSRTDGQPTLADIYCFAHAGGDARRFLAWQPAFDDLAQLIAVCPPRDTARPGSPLPGLDALIAGAAEAIGTRAATTQRPTYLFGHSFGALVAFEVARRLRELPQLHQLVASGLGAPHLLPSARVRDLAALDGPRFARALSFFGGLPPELLADADLQELLLPSVAADFRTAASYRYQPAAPLRIGVTVITGSADPHVPQEALSGWRQHCLAPPTVHQVPGDHFYFADTPQAITDLLAEVVGADQHVEVI